MASCRSCPAVIDWATLPDGKAIPVDRASADDPKGNLAVRRDGGRLAVRYLKGGEQPQPGEHRAISHFATCPNAAQHRTRRVREQQQEGPPPSPEDAYKALLAMWAAHLDCPMEKVGHCVYCKTHGARIGQHAPFTDEDKAVIRAECERLGVPVGQVTGG